MSPDTPLNNAPMSDTDLEQPDLEPSEFDAIEQEVFGEGEAVATPSLDTSGLDASGLDASGLEASGLETSGPGHEPQTTPDGMMPYGAYASEKTKRQEAMQRAEKVEAEATALRDELAAFKLRQQVEAQINQAPTPDPIDDRLDDPGRHAQWLHQGLNERLAQQAHHQQLQMSDFMARQSLGTDRVEAATQAFMAIKDQQPWVIARIKAAQSPHAEAVRWHEEQQILLTAQQAAAQRIQSGPQHLSAAHPAHLNPSARPVIPPNIGTRTNAIPANSQETFEDIEQGLWG
ncbi:MAG: hypothetical protein ABJN69_12995 [Hellea sp.]